MRILPEDRANAQIATEFVVECGSPRQVQLLPEAGGRDKAVAEFASEHARILRRDPEGMMILLIDLDQNENYARYKERIPDDLRDRVFVIGAKPDPEGLRSAAKRSFTQLGEQMAAECRSGQFSLWRHERLQHNHPELLRLHEHLRPILFD